VFTFTRRIDRHPTPQMNEVVPGLDSTPNRRLALVHFFFLPPPPPPPLPPPPFWSATQTRATYGDLCGMPDCGQTVGLWCLRHAGALALAWRRGPVCACTRVCWCRRIFTYIHTGLYSCRPLAEEFGDVLFNRRKVGALPTQLPEAQRQDRRYTYIFIYIQIYTYICMCIYI